MYFSSGDGPFYFPEELSAMTWFPHIWNQSINFGVSILPRLWIDYPFHFIVKLLSVLGFDWGAIEKIIWLSISVLGIYAIYQLAKSFVGIKSAYISVLLYLTNTYALFLFGGGQLGVALAYSLAPLVLLKFMRAIDAILDMRVKGNELRKIMIQNGLWIALLVAFDLRIAYLIMGAITLYLVFRIWNFVLLHSFSIRNFLFHIGSTILVPLIIAGTVHLFWILPMALVRGGSLGFGEEITNPGMLKFLSFADFPHTLTLLHPNWPENLFGKVYFMQPEFLVLPLIAFFSLLFIHSSHVIHFFALLALIGAFLAKGSQPFFGDFYVWCFQHIPGFVMFRDPTKFYVFTALSYSILIPFTLQRVAESKGISHIVSRASYIVFVILWCFTLRPLFYGELTGNFRPKTVPNEYVELKNILVSDTRPSRTLWIPSKEKFAYASVTHPVLSAPTLFDNASLSGIISIATSSSFIHTLNEAGVRYVIVPQDLDKTMYLTEYTFDPELRFSMIQTLTKTPLVQNVQFQDIAVFENQDFKKMDRFVPPETEDQQKMVYIGMLISGIAITLCFVLLICL